MWVNVINYFPPLTVWSSHSNETKRANNNKKLLTWSLSRLCSRQILSLSFFCRSAQRSTLQPLVHLQPENESPVRTNKIKALSVLGTGLHLDGASVESDRLPVGRGMWDGATSSTAHYFSLTERRSFFRGFVPSLLMGQQKYWTGKGGNWERRMTCSKEPLGRIKPAAHAARTEPLSTGHPLYQLSHQAAPCHILFIRSLMFGFLLSMNTWTQLNMVETDINDCTVLVRACILDVFRLINVPSSYDWRNLWQQEAVSAFFCGASDGGGLSVSDRSFMFWLLVYTDTDSMKEIQMWRTVLEYSYLVYFLHWSNLGETLHRGLYFHQSGAA